MRRPAARPSVVGVVVLATLAAGLGGAVSGAGAVPARATSVGSVGGGDPYFPADGNGGYDVRHYAVVDTYLPDTDRLTGRTTVTAVARRRLTAFHLDLALTPDAVLVDGARAAYRKVSKHDLRVAPRTPVRSGERFRVVVRYHGRPASVRADGVTPGVDLWFHEPGETAAMGEPQNGPWWFAANEIPADKATFDVTVRVPRGQQAVSNGTLLGRSRRDGLTAWHWRADEPMTTYLAFFVAGRFDVRTVTVAGRPYTYAVSRRLSTDEQAAARDVLDRTPGIVDWLGQQLGHYPFATSGGVVVDLAAGYSLETQTRPTYPWGAFEGTDAEDTALVVHEQAHQWFGDDVSLRRWQDLWLNEGFATYEEWAYDEAHGGAGVDARLRDEYDGGHEPGFWEVQVSDPTPALMWSTAVYERGAMMLAALRNVVGDADLDALLRQWVVAHAGRNATGDQFRALAEDVSGQDLTDFFAHWLDDVAQPADTEANGLGSLAP